MLVINTPLGEEVGVDDVYKGCIIQMRGYDLRVDLVLLEIHDFDIILWMNWLSTYHIGNWWEKRCEAYLAYIENKKKSKKLSDIFVVRGFSDKF